MNLLNQHKSNLHYLDAIAGMVDQSIDIALNLSQSGHPGGSRSKVPVLITTLLSGVMKWDIRNPGATFGDRFTLVAGHTNPVVYATLAVLNEALRIKYTDEHYFKTDKEMSELFFDLPEALENN